MKHLKTKKKTMIMTALLAGAMTLGGGNFSSAAAQPTQEAINMMATTPMSAEEKLDLTQEWDTVFPQSDKVTHEKVTFHNRYGITLAADLYIPTNASGKLAAIAVSGPFGAVKEQSSELYAQTLAERGYLTIAFDPSFTGESGGNPRNVSSPDINTEDFSAAVDYLSTRSDVDPERIGVCGFGGYALNAAAMDTRIKATVASTMYNMTRITAHGYNDTMDADARYQIKKELNAQRMADYVVGSYAKAGGVIDPLPADAPQFIKDYHAYYKTPRGYHPRSLNSTNGWNKTSALSIMNAPILQYSDEIRSAVLVIHGESAHSAYMSKDDFKKLKGDNKELLLILTTHVCKETDNKGAFIVAEQTFYNNPQCGCYTQCGMRRYRHHILWNGNGHGRGNCLRGSKPRIPLYAEVYISSGVGSLRFYKDKGCGVNNSKSLDIQKGTYSLNDRQGVQGGTSLDCIEISGKTENFTHNFIKP